MSIRGPNLAALGAPAGAPHWQEFGVNGRAASFVSLPFDHPLYILYSSGTTGVPKCIVHAPAARCYSIRRKHLLHHDLKRSDRLFYFTTCGWMMWNWLMSGLATGATLVLYDRQSLPSAPRGAVATCARSTSVAPGGEPASISQSTFIQPQVVK